MKEYRVKPDSQLSLDTYDPDDTGEYKKNEQGKGKAKASSSSLPGSMDCKNGCMPTRPARSSLCCRGWIPAGRMARSRA